MSVISSRFYKFPTRVVWLVALFPALFLSDILYGLMDFYNLELPVTPGVVIRGGLLIVAAYFTLRHRQLLGIALRVWLVMLFLFVLPSIVVGFGYSQSLFFDIQYLFKVLYFPFTVALVVVLIKRYRISIDEILKFIEYSAFLLGTSLLISQYLGMQKDTYGDYAFGSTGIFYAQNDMTLAFGLSLLAAAYRLVLIRFSWVRLVLTLLSVYACLQIGTRASLGIVVGIVTTVLVILVLGKSGDGRVSLLQSLKKWLLGGVFALVMIAMLGYGLSQQQEHSYQQQKLDQLSEGDFPRLLLVLAGASHIANRAGLFDITGEGMDSFQRGVANHFQISEDKKKKKLVEVDWLDLFGAYGIGFAILIHLFAIKVLVGAVRDFLIGSRNQVQGLIGSASILYLGHSALAGHALASPIPSTLMAGYFGIYFTWSTDDQRRDI